MTRDEKLDYLLDLTRQIRAEFAKIRRHTAEWTGCRRAHTSVGEGYQPPRHIIHPPMRKPVVCGG